MRHVLNHTIQLTNSSSCRWRLFIYHLYLIYRHSMLEAERLCTFHTWLFVELIQLLLWPNPNFEHKKPKVWCFQHAIIVSVELQEWNKLLLIMWTECALMANFSSTQGIFRNCQRTVNVSLRLLRSTFSDFFFFPFKDIQLGKTRTHSSS